MMRPGEEKVVARRLRQVLETSGGARRATARVRGVQGGSRGPSGTESAAARVDPPEMTSGGARSATARVERPEMKKA
jgi:hypothetical protein